MSNANAVPGFIVSIDGSERRLNSVEQLGALLAELATRREVTVSVDRDLGSTGAFRRFSGGPSRDVSPCFNLRKVDTVARLTFFDDAWSEYRSRDLSEPANPTSADLQSLAGPGEELPREECLSAPRAFAAIRDFLAHGARPEWLTYRSVT